MSNLKDIWLVKLMNIETNGELTTIHRYYRSKQPKESELAALITKHSTSLYELVSITNEGVKVTVYNNRPIQFKDLIIDQGSFIGDGQVSELSVVGSYDGQVISRKINCHDLDSTDANNDGSMASLLNIIGQALQSNAQKITTNMLEDNNIESEKNVLN